MSYKYNKVAVKILLNDKVFLKKNDNLFHKDKQFYF